MNKLVKIILVAIAIFLGVAGAGAWYAKTLIKPENLSQLIISSVKESTGRDLKISGPLSLHIFPGVAVTAEEVSMSNASWASSTDPNMLAVKRLECEIKLLPLFSKRVEIKSINLTGLDLHLETNKAGQANWDLSLPTTPSAGTSPGNNTSDSASSSDPSLPEQIENIHIADSKITYKSWGAPTKVISIGKLAYEAEVGKSEIDAQMQYQGYQLALKGKTGNLRSIVTEWGEKPIKTNLDFTLTLNGKSLAIKGAVDKKPQALAKFDVQVNSKSFDFVPLAAGAMATQAGAQNVSSSSSSGSSGNRGRYFFSEEDLPFGMLPVANGKIAFDIGELKVSGFAPLSNFKGDLIFNGDQMSANDMSFQIGKGSAQVQLAVSQFSGSSPAVSAKGMMKGFTLEQISSAVRPGTKVTGGDTQIAFNLRSSGLSPHQQASRATGAVQISVGSSTLDSRFLDSTGDLMMTAINAVNPMRKSTDQTTLECAVAYLPVSNGVLTINNSVGMVTDRLDIVLSGTVNFSNEALNVQINPTEKSGLTTGVDLAGLVKLGGTLMNPQAGVNKAGVVNSAVSIGLGILTGGATILAENARSLTNKPQPCKAALHSWSDIYPGSN